MKQFRLVVFILILLLTVHSTSSLGEGTAASVCCVKVSWEVLPFQSLTITGAGSSDSTVVTHFDLRKPTDADFALGYIEEKGALTLSAASNIPWTVKVHALEANMGRSYDGTYVKPLSDFFLRANGGCYFSITTFDQTLASSSTLGVHPLVVDYKVKTERDSYKEGDYSLTLVYTITGK